MSDETQPRPHEAAGSSKENRDAQDQAADSVHAMDAGPDGHEGSIGPGAPLFVAPSSYLRPLSRAQPAASGIVAGAADVSGSGSGSGSRPGTAASTGDGRQMTPLDKEQIEGLVSSCLFSLVRQCVRSAA